ILDLAKVKIGKQQNRVDRLLADLERDKKETHDTKLTIRKKERELEALKTEYDTLRVHLEENKKDILRKAKEEAKSILKDANKLIENTIAEIKTVKADREKTKLIRDKVNQSLHQHTEEVKKNIPQKVTSAHSELEVGDWVRIDDTGAEGEILEITRNDSLIIALGSLRTVVKKNRVTQLKSKQKSKAIKRQTTVSSESIADFHPEVDVRGMRTEDALQKIELVLDRAVMIGYP